MTDANWIFDRAMELMDEQNAWNGDTRNEDTAEFRFRTLGILNVLRHELYPYSDTFEPKRVCPALEAFDQPLDLDDALAQAVLPYGLAAHLLLEENPAAAAFFFQRYGELLYAIGCRKQAVWETITI